MKNIIVDLIWPFIAGILFMFLIAVVKHTAELEQQAVQKGFAEYNSTNGLWQWKRGE